MDLRAIGSFGLALSLSAALSAQTPTPATPGPDPAPSVDVDQQVREMRRQMTEGKTFRSHVRVTVRLKNGNRLTGVVKDGMVVERIDGIRFVAADADDPGAGIRLHYWNGKGNFIFVPFTDIQEYRINARLSAADLTLLERAQRELEAAEKQRQLAQNQEAAARAALAAEQGGLAAPAGESIEAPAPQEPAKAPQPAAPAAPSAAAPAAAPSAATSAATELQSLLALVQEFPPSAGWSQQKRDEIARRQAVIGAKPTAQEQRFVDKFADWQRACALFPQTPAAEAPAETETKGKSRRGRK